MPLLRLEDLFDAMKEVLSSKYGYTPSQIKTKIIGIRPGEKLIGYLLAPFEMESVFETKDFFIIPSLNKSVKNSDYPNAKKPKNVQSYFEDKKHYQKKKYYQFLNKLIYPKLLCNLFVE